MSRYIKDFLLNTKRTLVELDQNIVRDIVLCLKKVKKRLDLGPYFAVYYRVR